jgi:hypothetical protein
VSEFDFTGKRVVMDAADHPHGGEEGVVVRAEPCHTCADHGLADCGYPDLIVRLDDGTETRVYEPECSLVSD